MTAQVFTKEFKSTPEKLAEAKELMKGLSFRETYSVCDGYESWESSRDNLDAFAALIERARKIAVNHDGKLKMHKLTRNAYAELVEGDLEWLRKQPETLERDHIKHILSESVNLYYPNNT